MALVSLQEVCLGFGGPLLLDGVDLQIERGERIGLLGRNGMGKSTLLKLIQGELTPESGTVARQQNLKLAYLPQEVPQGLAGSVYDIVAKGLISANGFTGESALDIHLPVKKALSRMQLDPSLEFNSLSAGLKRRVLLARGLVNEPDLLLLDEPTNHLDIESINWLENFLLRWGGTLLFVTHDRVFLQRLTTRIIELDRGKLFDWSCSYSVFLQRKEAMTSAEQVSNSLFDKKLAKEEAWIRQGIEARRTRNEGRVRALKRLRELRRERREQPGRVRLHLQEYRRSGKIVIEAEGVDFSYDSQPILKDFSTTILRGDKIGIIGPNGSGKTTLLRLLSGDLQPQKGEIEMGTNIEVAYFDQLRAQLDENKSVLDNVGEGRDTITINGKSRNLIGYLEDFLFSSDRVHAPISVLSGGERNRLLLARLFAKTANFLALDEPTNDLDIETLELLEDLLLEFNGTLLLVSHDRAFLNNLVTSTFVMGGNGEVKEFVGGYDDTVLQDRAGTSEVQVEKPKRPIKDTKREESQADIRSPRKRTNKEQRAFEDQKKEWGEIPDLIEKLEAEQHDLTLAMANPQFYQQEAGLISKAASRHIELEEELRNAYQRWEELEEIFGVEEG